MSELSVRHHSYIELLSATARLDTAIAAAVKNPMRIETLIDFMPTKYSTTQVNEAFAGAYQGLGWFELDAPTTDSTPVAACRFGAMRASADKYSADGSLLLGTRTVLRGTDDGTNVTMSQDGVDLGSLALQADWTPAENQDLVLPATLYIGYDDNVGLYTNLLLYEYWMKLNGILVAHWRPLDTDSVSIPDLSEFGHDARIGAAGAAGVLGTDYIIRSAMNEGMEL